MPHGDIIVLCIPCIPDSNDSICCHLIEVLQVENGNKSCCLLIFLFFWYL